MSWMPDKLWALSRTDGWKGDGSVRPSDVCQGYDEWGYVDCGGVVGLALEPVELYCNRQPMTAVIA